VWRLAALVGAAAAVAGLVVLLPASLRARGRLLVAAFLAAIGVLPLVVRADDTPAAPPTAKAVNADYLARLIREGPFSEKLPDPLVAEPQLVVVTISGRGAAGIVSGVQVKINGPTDGSAGGGAFLETYRSVQEAKDRVTARILELRDQMKPLWANEGDPEKGYCIAGAADYWSCGAYRGDVVVEVNIFPSNNANHAVATGTVQAVLRYVDRMTVLARA
jgi:hypothetical protein